MTKRPDLPALTGIRAIASTWVILHHYGQYYLSPGPLRDICAQGSLGVSLFFILSGFVLAYSAQPDTSPPAFWWARIARIYPLYAIALLIDLAPTIHMGTQLGPTIPAYLTLTSTWFPAYRLLWDSPTWSLAAEAFFYILFPIILPVIATIPRRLLFLVPLLCWAVSYLGYRHGLTLYDPPLRLPEFVMGCALGLLYVRYGALRARRVVIPACVGVLLVGLVSSASLNPTFLNVCLYPGLFGLLLYALAPTRGLLAHPVMIKGGGASFAVYLIHVPLWHWLGWITGLNGEAAYHRSLLFWPYLLLVWAAALLLHERVERSAQTWLRARAPRWPGWRTGSEAFNTARARQRNRLGDAVQIDCAVFCEIATPEGQLNISDSGCGCPHCSHLSS